MAARVSLILPFLTAAVILTTSDLALAGTFIAFGPQNYTRATGNPVTVITSFTVLNPNTTYTLRINNGGLVDREFEKVSSSVFILNGVHVVGPDEFNQNVMVIEKPITLNTTNELSVEVRGTPGGGLTVQIIGVDDDLPTITASVSPSPNAPGWYRQDVTVSFTCTDATSGIATCSEPISVGAEGANQVMTGTATDRAGNTATASVSLNLDKTPPAIVLTAPAASFATNRAALSVTGNVTDANPITEVSLNGTPLTLTDGAFGLDLTLNEGSNSLTIKARDIADNIATLSRTVTLDTTPPRIAITSPEGLSTFNSSNVQVIGTVDDSQAGVTINGISAPVSNGSFAVNLTLAQGTRFVTAVASDPLGNTGTAGISVTIDTTPPRVIINTPADGTTVFSSPVTVTGMINDIVSGTVNGNNATVTINGVPAIVSNRGFVAQGISLSPGANTITALGTDAAGNQAQAMITVTLDTTAKPKIKVVSGDNQAGRIGTALPQPLVVILHDAVGSPVANKPVAFGVTRNNGSSNAGLRIVTQATDSQGKAQVNLTLGSYAGAGENRVEASSPGFAGPAVFTATGTAGQAVMVHQVNDSVFRGAVNTALPQPLQVIVSDAGGNPVAGVPVTFTVVAGKGRVENDTLAQVITNSDGKAHVTWILGPDEGIANNRVEAGFSGNTGLPVTFMASGVIPGDPANTTFSGIILTNTEQPIPGVTITIPGTNLVTQTNDQGQFKLTGVPVGAIHLIADANTATLPGFPYEMMYEVNTIAGRDNTIGMPMYLLPLDLPNAKTITPTQGATIKCPERRRLFTDDSTRYRHLPGWGPDRIGLGNPGPSRQSPHAAAERTQSRDRLHDPAGRGGL